MDPGGQSRAVGGQYALGDRDTWRQPLLMHLTHARPSPDARLLVRPSDLCLDLYRDATKVHACPCHSDANQQWSALPNGQLASLFRPDLCLNAAGLPGDLTVRQSALTGRDGTAGRS